MMGGRIFVHCGYFTHPQILWLPKEKNKAHLVFSYRKFARRMNSWSPKKIEPIRNYDNQIIQCMMNDPKSTSQCRYMRLSFSRWGWITRDQRHMWLDQRQNRTCVYEKLRVRCTPCICAPDGNNLSHIFPASDLSGWICVAKPCSSHRYQAMVYQAIIRSETITSG